ncbi:MAG TPA: FAD-binding oxidoreductase [Paraburkholderia sp.]|jgi:FAD/FMN-containing dehydrogenase
METPQAGASTAQRGGLAAQLAALLGSQQVFAGPAVPERYCRDWSGDYVGVPLAVIRPANVDEVAAALTLCAVAGVKVIPQGGNTGLVGAGIADTGNQVVLSLERLNRVRSVDSLGMSMVVEAGCVLQNVKDAAAEHGCLFPLALGAQGSCQIGGNISTNAGGVNVLRYGMMRNLVLGIEAVLPDGRVFSDLRALRKNNTGLDLKQLFVGAEGTLGVITAATLKLFARPRWVETLWLSARSVDDIMAIYGRLQREGGELLSAFELITAPCLALALELDPNPVAWREVSDHPAHALIEFSASGGPDLKPWVEALVAELFEAGLAVGGLHAQSGAQAASMWRIRELMVEAQQQRGTHLRTDVSVPIASMAELVARAEKALVDALPGVKPLSYGHVGDGNAHLNALPPGDMEPAAFAQWIPRLTGVINELIDEFGGSISAEHGIGLSKRAAFDARVPAVERELMARIKAAFDASSLLSPNRILPNSGGNHS